MSNSKRVVIAVALLGAVVAFQGVAQAQKKGGGGSTGSTSCKSDRALDVPMQFTATVEGYRVHVSASGGSDKSGYIVPSVWRLYDATGKQVDYFPKSVLVFVSPKMLNETNFEGLVPGASYSIELTSLDWCNNPGTVRQPVMVSPVESETNPPILSTPAIAMVGLQNGQFGQIQFSVTDGTGVQQIEVYISGTKVKDFKYYDGVGVRWWCENYTLDNAQSVLEGPNYYIYPPDVYRGQYALVEVDATDVFGNRVTTSAWLAL